MAVKLYKAYITVAINIIMVVIDNLLKTRGMVVEKEKRKERRKQLTCIPIPMDACFNSIGGGPWPRGGYSCRQFFFSFFFF
jgi:hypothetical protein